jgi:outer membrane protein
MKNISLILNGVLIIAVGLLYYFHFSSAKGPVALQNESVPSNIKIAYINSDSVLSGYDFFKATKDILEAKGKRLDSDFRNRAQGLQNDYASYQKNVGNLTIGQAKAIEEDLAKKQQNLQLYQQSLQQEVAKDESKVTQDLYKRITDYLKVYSQEQGYHIIFKYDPSSDLLFGAATFDITKQVIQGLNDAYKIEKNGNSASQIDTATAKKK